jgi:hypothetical protein
MEPKPPADKSDKNQGRGKPEITFELGSVQIIEDHDTRGDPRYPPVKMPRILPKDMRPRRPSEEG